MNNPVNFKGLIPDRRSCRYGATVNKVCNYTKVPPEGVTDASSPTPDPAIREEERYPAACPCGYRGLCTPPEV
jgi:hypothetical protein